MSASASHENSILTLIHLDLGGLVLVDEVYQPTSTVVLELVLMQTQKSMLQAGVGMSAHSAKKTWHPVC